MSGFDFDFDWKDGEVPWVTRHGKFIIGRCETAEGEFWYYASPDDPCVPIEGDFPSQNAAWSWAQRQEWIDLDDGVLDLLEAEDKERGR